MSTQTNATAGWKIGDFYFYGAITCVVGSIQREIPYKIIESEETAETEEGFRMVGLSPNGERQLITSKEDISHMRPCSEGEAKGFVEDLSEHLTSRTIRASDDSVREMHQSEHQRLINTLSDGWFVN